MAGRPKGIRLVDRRVRRKNTVNVYKVTFYNDPSCLVVAKTVTQVKNFLIGSDYIAGEKDIIKVEKVREIPKSNVKIIPSWSDIDDDSVLI